MANLGFSAAEPPTAPQLSYAATSERGGSSSGVCHEGSVEGPVSFQARFETARRLDRSDTRARGILPSTNNRLGSRAHFTQLAIIRRCSQANTDLKRYRGYFIPLDRHLADRPRMTLKGNQAMPEPPRLETISLADITKPGVEYHDSTYFATQHAKLPSPAEVRALGRGENGRAFTAEFKNLGVFVK